MMYKTGRAPGTPLSPATDAARRHLDAERPASLPADPEGPAHRERDGDPDRLPRDVALGPPVEPDGGDPEAPPARDPGPDRARRDPALRHDVLLPGADRAARDRLQRALRRPRLELLPRPQRALRRVGRVGARADAHRDRPGRPLG